MPSIEALLIQKRKGIIHDLGPNLHLTVQNGFFVTLDDWRNRSSPLSHILLPKTIVEFFMEQFPQQYRDIHAFFQLTGESIDPLDSRKLQTGASIAYFLALVEYVRQVRPRIKKVDDLYTEWTAEDVNSHFQYYLSNLVLAAREQGVRATIYSLFPFAVRAFQAIYPDIRLPAEFTGLNKFLLSRYASPYTRRIFGERVENELQLRFEAAKDEEFLSCLYRRVGARGVLIPLDTVQEMGKIINRMAPGYKVPDYLFVTERFIYPIDLKASLDHAHDVQVSGKNIAGILERCAHEFSALFAGMVIEGVSFA